MVSTRGTVDCVRGVVAMREPVRYDTASNFSKALYSEIGTMLADKLLPGTSTELYWGTAVTRSRNSLYSQTADCKAWTLPVLYLQPKPILLRVPEDFSTVADTNLVQQKLAKITELLRMSEEFRDAGQDEVAQAIDAKVAELRAEMAHG